MQQDVGKTGLRNSTAKSDAGSSVGNPLYPRVTESFEIDLESLQSVEQLQQVLAKKVEEQDPELTAVCTNGFDF